MASLFTVDEKCPGQSLGSLGGSAGLVSLSYGKEDEILGGPLQVINFLFAEDNCLQLAGSLVQNEAIFLEFSLTYDDGAHLKLGPGAKCPPCPPSWHP